MPVPVWQWDSAPGVDGPAVSGEPASSTGGTDAAAREQAQAWLDTATLPSGAIRADASVATFSLDQGWPCGPVEELEAFWTIPGATVSETAHWLRENPTADLISTSLAPVSDDAAVSSTSVGYIPELDAQEGIVYTIMTTTDDVAVHAEIEARTESVVCPTPLGGGIWASPASLTLHSWRRAPSRAAESTAHQTRRATPDETVTDPRPSPRTCELDAGRRDGRVHAVPMGHETYATTDARFSHLMPARHLQAAPVAAVATGASNPARRTRGEHPAGAHLG